MLFRCEKERDGTIRLLPHARREGETRDKVTGMMPRLHGNENTSILDEAASQNFLQEIDNYIEGLESSLWSLNKYIHDNPELAFEEYKTHDALTNYMQSQEGWLVTKSACGLETAWIAVYDSGKPGPVVSFNAEMDALPNMGHACGHNLIAAASIAAGLATAHILKHHSLPGAVKILGTPGEEGTGGGKIQLLEAGAYEGVDISLISHPSIINNSPRVRTTAFTRLDVEYFGKAAHAANAPWKGINALDALVIAYNAVSSLRQQTMPSDVIGMNITHGGSKPNEIHDYAAGTCVLRAHTSSRLGELREKITACLRAGGAATGARVEIRVTRGYADHVPSLLLASSYEDCWNALPSAPGPLIPLGGKYTHVKASTDQGDISHAMPSVNASFAIPPGKDGGGPHRPDFEGASGTREAYWRAVRVGKCLAGVAVDVLTKEGMRERVWEEFRIRMARKAQLERSRLERAIR